MELTADEWQANNHDPAFVRSVRDDLNALGFEPPTSLARIPDWLDGKKGAVTRKLNAGDE